MIFSGTFKTIRAGFSNESRSQSGVTIVELLSGIALSALIGGIMVSSMFELTKASELGQAQQAVTVQIRAATLWLERDIARASSSNVPDPGSPLTTAQFDWTDEVGPHSCVYALTGTDLIRTCDSVPISVAKHLTGLQFTRSGQLVTVGFTATSPDLATKSESVSINLAMRSS
jgi:type II secretory pathway pseudopilin PulG